MKRTLKRELKGTEIAEREVERSRRFMQVLCLSIALMLVFECRVLR